MARRFAPLLTAIWDDDDFCALTPAAQRMYMQLLSQKRLSLCGVLPYAPRNLARGCTHLTVTDINTALEELEQHRYILIDHDTDEILVRTILKHDPPRGIKVIQGMWSSWLEIDSEPFRRHVVHSLSDELWGWEGVKIPQEAKHLRNTLSNTVFHEPERHETKPPSPYYHLPPTSNPPSNASSSRDNSNNKTHMPVDDDDEINQLVNQTINLIVDHRCQGRTITNPRAYKAAIRREIIELDHQHILDAVTAGRTPADTAAAFTNPTPTTSHLPWCAPDCPTCDGTAFIDTGNGYAPCPERTTPA